MRVEVALRWREDASAASMSGSDAQFFEDGERMKPRVVLLGSTGGLGREVLSQLHDAGLPVRTPRVVQGKLDGDVIINCAALTGIERCFREPEKAWRVNMDLPDTFSRYGVPLLHVSTDAVFPCMDPDEDHSERGETDPRTLYGRTKRAGEVAGTTVVRLPLLFGANNRGQIVGSLVRKALAGEEVRVANDVYNTPLGLEVAAWWIMRWCWERDKPKLVHLCGDQRLSLYDLVSEITEAIGAKVNLVPTKSSDFPSSEPKPKWGGLSSLYEPCFSLELAIDRYAKTWSSEPASF